ncbi:MAG: hypothetical protein IPN76_16645 [Saprospiraceae bacterium]|nr:hypothetical protein [Saprospiraceae bacterium]
MMAFQELKVMQLEKEPKTGNTQVVPITYKVQIASKKTKMEDSEFYNHRNKCKCELLCEEEEGNWRYYLETVFEDYKEAVNARDEISLYFQKPFVVVCDSKGRRI